MFLGRPAGAWLLKKRFPEYNFGPIRFDHRKPRISSHVRAETLVRDGRAVYEMRGVDIVVVVKKSDVDEFISLFDARKPFVEPIHSAMNTIDPLL